MDQSPTSRRPRLAFLVLPGLDHFTPELIEGLRAAADWEVMAFKISSPGDFHTALAWAHRPGIDALWFEFCWPPFGLCG